MSKSGLTEFLLRCLPENDNPEVSSLDQAIALYAMLVGGIPLLITLVMELPSLIQGNSLWLRSGSAAISALMIGSLQLYTVYGGRKLWQGEARGLGILAACQIPQLAALAGGGWVYSVSLGVRVLAGFWDGSPYAHAGFGRAKIIWSGAPGFGLAINFVAIAWTVILVRRHRQVEHQAHNQRFEGHSGGIETLVMKRGASMSCAYCGARNTYADDLQECVKCGRAFHFE